MEQLSLFAYAGLDETGLKPPKTFTLEEIFKLYKEVAEVRLLGMASADQFLGKIIEASK